MGFLKHYSAKVFIVLFVLLSVLVLFLDVEATVLFGLSFEEAILFPAFGILFLAFGLLILKNKVSGKSDLLRELVELSFVSKFFGMLSIFLIIMAVVLVVFQDMSLFNLTPHIIAEERLVVIGILFSTLAFIILSSREIERRIRHV